MNQEFRLLSVQSPQLIPIPEAKLLINQSESAAHQPIRKSYDHSAYPYSGDKCLPLKVDKSDRNSAI